MKSKLFFSLIFLCLLIPSVVFGVEFKPLVGIPGLETYTGKGSLNLYINALYRLSISIAALLAVIKIVAAGAKYMLTDIVPAKEEAKKDIQGALIGLLIVIGAVIILNTVNSDLTKVDFNIEPIKLEDALPVNPIVKQCEDMFPGGSGGCTYTSCENIGGDLSTYMVDGALAGGAIGLVAGPGGVVTVPGGAIVGTITGAGLFVLENAASCATVCSWKGGKIIGDLSKITSNTACVAPTDQEAVRKARLAEVKENSCYRKLKDWDASSLSCSENNCNINSNVKCCSANGGTITNNICAFNLNDQGSDNQNRIDCNRIPGRVWTEPSGPCRVTSGKEIVPGTDFPLPIDVADLNPDIPSELNEIKAACQRGGESDLKPFEYSRELNRCVQYQ